MIMVDSRSLVEKKLSFWDKHPVLAGVGTMGFGVVAMAAIDGFFYWVGGVKLMDAMGIVPICVGALFVFKGFLKIRYSGN